MPALAIPFAHANVEQPDSTADRHASIRTVASHARGGCATLNEAGKDGPFIRALPGFDAFACGENAVIWHDSFVVVKRARYLVMRGGKLGAGGRAVDRRRRGPNRYVVAVVLRDPKSRHVWLVATYHAVAKADTSAKWRRPIRAAGLRLAGIRLSRLAKRWPDGVLTGDLNARGPVNFPRLAEHPVKAPATLGRMHYDRLFTMGKLQLRGVKTFRTRADHLGLSAALTIAGKP